MFEWSDEFSTGIGTIDAQHRSLFGVAHELHAAMAAGQARGALSKILDRLVQYTSMHFAHEERLMRLHGYPDYEAHQAQHAALTQQVLKFQADFRSGKVLITVQLLTFLKGWLEKHIKGVDQKYVPHLKARQVA
jgi:hemerythrin-like metal-binding protein